DNELSFSLLTKICEDHNIKQVLYPPLGPQPTMANSGATWKSEAHWLLCVALFTNHPQYQDVFSHVDPKKKGIKVNWANKIKNWLSEMEDITTNLMKELGATGVGIK
ncbi:hypothetical protein P691DRAFT_684643, partial [Macrolepiota fuliginosa MF-IS2]